MIRPGGRSLRVLDSGGDGDAGVLFLHGTPSSALPYAPNAEDARSRGLRFVSYDRPGYAGSDPQPGRTVADAAADVDAIADALQIERLGVWGISGGGPHALAVAALSERVAAVASLASPAPLDAEGLDWFDGMGELNIHEFGLAQQGRDALEPSLRELADALRMATPTQLADELQTLLSAPDTAVLTGELAEWLHASFGEAVAERLDGWIDDDLAFLAHWGFRPTEPRVPLLLWHGEQDHFVPVAHGRWLAEHIPGADVRITAEDGHLTLQQTRVPDVHAWLAARLQA